MKLLALETSCDESAVAILDLQKFLDGAQEIKDILLCDLVSSQAKLHEPYGGVVPELAAREHVVNVPLLVQQAFAAADTAHTDLAAVAVTQGPGLKGCLLSGICFAKGLCFGSEIPLYPINHLEGHLVAAFLLEPHDRPAYPLLTLLVSGGHTMLILVKDFGSYTILARTRDDAAGEAFDKIATLLGLPYPGGPALAKLAVGGDPRRFSFPLGVPKDSESFSFSGLKTAVMRTVSTLHKQQLLDVGNTRSDLAACAQYAIIQSLLTKTVKAVECYRPKSVAVAGGVAANTELRSALVKALAPLGVQCCLPPPRWCTDNASMIGLAACMQIKQQYPEYLAWLRSSPKTSLGPNAPFALSAETRWRV